MQTDIINPFILLGNDHYNGTPNELFIALPLFFIPFDIMIATLATFLTCRLPTAASLSSSPQLQIITIYPNIPIEHITPLLHILEVSA
jgi:hypothetical protein